MHEHIKGLLITAAGVILLSPDAVLVREVGAPEATTVIWRGLLSGIVLAVALAVAHGGGLGRAVRGMGRWGVVCGALFAVNTTLFVYSIEHTAAANTLVIIAGGPLFGAVLSRFALGEAVAAETWIATMLVVLGIGVVVGDGLAQGTWRGDLAGIVVSLSLSANFVIMRKRKDISMVPATGLGFFASGVIALAAAAVGAVPGPVVPPSGDVVPLVLMGAAVLPAAFGLITLGPRRITAPEVGLLMLLETVLGPLWVWLLRGELASATALAAGAFVVVTLCVYFTVRLRRVRAEAPT